MLRGTLLANWPLFRRHFGQNFLSKPIAQALCPSMWLISQAHSSAPKLSWLFRWHEPWQLPIGIYTRLQSKILLKQQWNLSEGKSVLRTGLRKIKNRNKQPSKSLLWNACKSIMVSCQSHFIRRINYGEQMWTQMLRTRHVLFFKMKGL